MDYSKPGFAANALQGRATIQSNAPREHRGKVQHETLRS